MKKIRPSVMESCARCGYNTGQVPATCLGCGREFKPCADHWPLFTYCSKKCATPHRKRLNEILFEPLRGRGPSW